MVEVYRLAQLTSSSGRWPSLTKSKLGRRQLVTAHRVEELELAQEPVLSIAQVAPAWEAVKGGYVLTLPCVASHN